MVALLSRKQSSSLLLFLTSCLLTTPLTTYNSNNSHFTLADAALTRDQLYAQYGLVKNWVAPMPGTPIAAAGLDNASPGPDTGVGYILQNWSTNYKTITVGANDVSFIADPFPSSTPAAANSNNSTANANSQVMQVIYPKGSYAPKAGPITGGTSFYAKPFGDDTPFEKMMISYDVAFPSGFDWVLGGKLPGIYGGNQHTCTGGNQSTGDNCLSMRLMWRQDGGGEVYAYIPVENGSDFCKNSNVQCNDQFGKSIGRGLLYFPPGTWTRVDMVMQLNEPAGYNNGILDVYLNGLKAISMNTIPYRTTGMVGFQGLMFSTFFGGNTPQYATPVDTAVFFRNVQLSVGEPARLYEGNGGSAAGGKIVGSRFVGESIVFSLFAVLLGLLFS
ncbi:hypothetical protein BGW39_000248 [Mortierella sp. 14UC]|nr:hypothetical protein BGW39_000248 [Mortierella sp. 14UC]